MLRLPRLTDIVHELTGGSPPRDDISIAHIALTDTPQPVPAVSSGDSPAAPTASDWRFVLRLGAADLKRLDAVPLILGAIEQFEGVRPFAGRLFLVLSELFNNALDHGLLRLPSSLKAGVEGMDVFLDERTRRLARLARWGRWSLNFPCASEMASLLFCTSAAPIPARASTTNNRSAPQETSRPVRTS
jgi:hypothetical protein